MPVYRRSVGQLEYWVGGDLAGGEIGETSARPGCHYPQLGGPAQLNSGGCARLVMAQASRNSTMVIAAQRHGRPRRS